MKDYRFLAVLLIVLFCSLSFGQNTWEINPDKTGYFPGNVWNIDYNQGAYVTDVLRLENKADTSNTLKSVFLHANIDNTFPKNELTDAMFEKIHPFQFNDCSLLITALDGSLSEMAYMEELTDSSMRFDFSFPGISLKPGVVYRIRIICSIYDAAVNSRMSYNVQFTNNADIKSSTNSIIYFSSNMAAAGLWNTGKWTFLKSGNVKISWLKATVYELNAGEYITIQFVDNEKERHLAAKVQEGGDSLYVFYSFDNKFDDWNFSDVKTNYIIWQGDERPDLQIAGLNIYDAIGYSVYSNEYAKIIPGDSLSFEAVMWNSNKMPSTEFYYSWEINTLGERVGGGQDFFNKKLPFHQFETTKRISFYAWEEGDYTITFTVNSGSSIEEAYDGLDNNSYTKTVAVKIEGVRSEYKPTWDIFGIPVYLTKSYNALQDIFSADIPGGSVYFENLWGTSSSYYEEYSYIPGYYKEDPTRIMYTAGWVPSYNNHYANWRGPLCGITSINFHEGPSDPNNLSVGKFHMIRLPSFDEKLGSTMSVLIPPGSNTKVILMGWNSETGSYEYLDENSLTHAGQGCWAALTGPGTIWYHPKGGLSKRHPDAKPIEDVLIEMSNFLPPPPPDIVLTGVNEQTMAKPSKFSLKQNYPNPFNPETTINYTINAGSYVKLTIVNVSGQQVDVLVSENKPAGEYTVQWNGSNSPSGTYFYRLEAGDNAEFKQMILLK